MKLKILPTSKVYQQLFILILLLQNSVLGQIDWAEDDDDPGNAKSVFEVLFEQGLKVLRSFNLLMKILC